ncbi:MAG: hypothetical protein J2P25_08350 [Nocardiopsaceae bacterium]|nr:hypothetical protein [Nocardiopsaceae bacterium]
MAQAAELAVEHFAQYEEPEPLERPASAGRAPVVIGQLPDRLGQVGGQGPQTGLAPAGLVAQIGRQHLAFLLDGGVDESTSLVEEAIETTATAYLLLAVSYLPYQVIADPPGLPVQQNLPERIPQGFARFHPVKDLFADRVGDAA